MSRTSRLGFARIWWLKGLIMWWYRILIFECWNNPILNVMWIKQSILKEYRLVATDIFRKIVVSKVDWIFPICRLFTIRNSILLTKVIKKSIRLLYKTMSAISSRYKYMMNLIILMFRILESTTKMYWLSNRLTKTYSIFFLDAVLWVQVVVHLQIQLARLIGPWYFRTFKSIDVDFRTIVSFRSIINRDLNKLI